MDIAKSKNVFRYEAGQESGVHRGHHGENAIAPIRADRPKERLFVS
jgi:hypothetical protein